MYYVWGNPLTRLSIPRSNQLSRVIIRPESSLFIGGNNKNKNNKKKLIGKRKRHVYVYDPEEVIIHEPYMLSLYREYNDEPIVSCDSTVEIPWKDIVLSMADVKLQQEKNKNINQKLANQNDDNDVDETNSKSTNIMELPWNELLVTEVVDTRHVDDDDDVDKPVKDLINCDSSVEIPWGELELKQPVEICPLPVVEQCTSNDDIEIPWDDIMTPKNIVIKNNKNRKHVSIRKIKKLNNKNN
ncbi:uncharacterized protein LOC122848124, partial [Aphidius gifuensis]|uniref:uncharacterized protein LOC122848124 n=1 Tax=Aphidius gifuensis TaxID=684658 RepID=UPI001CDBCBE3